MAGCPHCGTTVKETPQLSGKVVKCPRCQQAFQMPNLPPPGAAPPMGAPPLGGSAIGSLSAPPPPVNAYASPAPPPKDFSADFPTGPSIGVSSGSSFRPRAYPAINMLITVLYVIAGLIALGGVIFEVIILIGGGRVMSLGRGGSAESGLVAILFGTLMNGIYCGLGILYSIAMAEMLRLFLDIQNNTHETVYWTRRGVKD